MPHEELRRTSIRRFDFMLCRMFSMCQASLCTVAVFLVVDAPGAADETALPINVPYRKLGYLRNPQIDESSGLACSRRVPDLFWTHNDSGDEPRLFAFDRQGNDRGEFVMEGAEAHDWEDMASFMLDGRPCLLIADVGDNQSRAAGYTLYLVEEPELTTNPTTNRRLDLLQTVHFRYSDGPHDCEAMAFDPTDRRAFLVAKTTRKNSNIYMFEWPSTTNSSDTPAVAEQIATVDYPRVTGMDTSPNGRRIVLVTYGLAFELFRAQDETWSQAFARTGRPLIMPFRRQGESICYGPDGRKLYLTSEKRPTPFFETESQALDSISRTLRDSP